MGYQYDGNGNLTQAPGATYSYDGANRMVSNGAAYDPRNRRVWDGSQIYFYGPNGQMLAKYQPLFSANSQFTRTSVNIWFGGRLVRDSSGWVMTDRVGSVRANGSGQRSSYYPYGQEMQATADGRTKFATYYRDSPGLDYADQRYYGVGTGRFMTADPGGIKTAIPGDPSSWNRYGYVQGDPINFTDRHGTCRDDENGDSNCQDHDPYGYDSPPPDAGPPCNPYTRTDNGCGEPGGDGPDQVSNKIMQEELVAGLNRAARALLDNPNCAALFGGGPYPDPITVLSQISNSFNFAPIEPPPGSPAGTVTSATTTGTGQAGYGAITVNTSVTIVLNNTSAGASFVSGNVNDWAVTILHELGHVFYDLYGSAVSQITPDTNSTAKSEANTALVKQNCKL